MEVPRLGMESELQLLVHTAAVATRDADLQEHWILNPLSEARDGTHFLMDTSGVLFH